MMMCKTCVSFDKDEDCCIFCKGYNPDMKTDSWDIFDLDENEWGHIQLRERLDEKGIACIFCDLWTDDNMAYIIGVNADTGKVAKALNIHEKSVYNDHEHGFIILNLFQEKYLRGMLDD